MKPSTARALALGLAVTFPLLVQCGPAPTPERGAAVPLAIGSAAPVGPAAPSRPEAGPRAPDDLTMLVRISDPEQLTKELASMLPPHLAAVATAMSPSQMLTLLLGARLGDMVDPSQPVDIASIGLGEPAFVVSMAVKQDAEGKLSDGRTVREQDGIWDPSAPAAGRLTACAFTAAAGRSPTRLLCASDDASLTAAAPYLARNVAAEPPDADVRLTMPGKVLRDGTAKVIGNAASARFGADLVDRFLDEIDHVDADLRFAAPGLELGLDLRLSTRESMFARVVVPRTKPAVPPRAFYRLPADSIFALHTTGALPEDIAPLRKAMADNIEGTLVQDGYQADKTHALRERIEGLLLTGGPLVLAAGVAGGRDGAEKALAALDAALGNSSRAPRGNADDQARAETQARGALVPWMLFEMEEPAERWITGLRDIVRRADEADKTRKPGSKSSLPTDPDGDHVDVRIGTLDPKLKLPKDTLDLEVLLTPHTKGKRPARRGHVFVVPKGTSTWIGYSEDAAAVAARLRLAIDDASEAGTLARSSEAAALRARPAVGAGLLSLVGLAYLTTKTTTSDAMLSAAQKATRASGLARSGGTEMLSFTLSADPAPGRVHVGVRAQATRQTAADLLRIFGL